MWLLLLFSCLMSMEVDKESTVVAFESKSLPSCNQKLEAGMSSSVRIGFEIPDQGHGWGSGNYFKLGKYKFVITASHVVSETDNLFILENDEKVPIKVVYNNIYRDIAIVVPEWDLEARPRNLKINSDEDIVGEMVNYTGYPSDLGKSTYIGYVSKSNQQAVIMQSFALPGSSGSVVFDKKGRAIGIVSAVKVAETGLSPFPELVESLVFVERFSFLNKKFLKEVFMNGSGGK